MSLRLRPAVPQESWDLDALDDPTFDHRLSAALDWAEVLAETVELEAAA